MKIKQDIFKNFVKASTYLAFALILSKSLSILTAPILTRLISPASYGAVNVCMSIVSFLATLGMMGIDLSLTRFYFNKNDTNNIARSFCWKFCLYNSILFSLFSFGFVFFSLREKLSSQEFIFSLIYAVIAVPLTNLVNLSFLELRLKLQHKILSFNMMISAAFAAALTILLSTQIPNSTSLFLGSLLGLIINFALSILKVKSIPMINFFDIDSFKENFYLVRFGFPTALSAILYWVVTSSDKWIMVNYISDYNIGIYSVASTIPFIGITLNSIIHTSFFPEASRQFSDTSKNNSSIVRLYRLISLVIISFSMVTSILGPDLFQKIVSVDFHLGAKYIPYFSISIMFYGLSSLANLPYFLTNNMFKITKYWIIIALLCITLNFILIPTIGPLGACISQIIAFGTLFILLRVNSTHLVAVDQTRIGICVIIACISPFLLPDLFQLLEIQGLFYTVILKFVYIISISCLCFLYVDKRSFKILTTIAK